MSEADQIEQLEREVRRQIADFRRIARDCWARQNRNRPIASFVARLRARQATRFADRLEQRLNDR